MRIRLQTAAADHAASIVSLRTAVAQDLTSRHGNGPWSSVSSERGVLYDMRNSTVFVVEKKDEVIATLRLCTKKPWAIDKKYFSASKKPLYLLSMAVHPSLQRQGIGRICMDEAKRIASEWPSDAIRLDAYDAVAGAGEFYRKCGFREVGRASYRDTPLIYYEMLL
jgi:ribosomal protein S18 acetylase RimI-like enzyme